MRLARVKLAACAKHRPQRLLPRTEPKPAEQFGEFSGNDSDFLFSGTALQTPRGRASPCHLTNQPPGKAKWRVFSTEEFKPPLNPADWKFGDVRQIPADPNAGRQRLPGSPR
jgi:hypothetical protein